MTVVLHVLESENNKIIASTCLKINQDDGKLKFGVYVLEL